jgi:alkylation response protein AidB-like acyl-CoA dehydrogenase
MAKLFSGRMARMVADHCIQLHGGFGYMKESVAGRASSTRGSSRSAAAPIEVMMHYLAKMLGF